MPDVTKRTQQSHQKSRREGSYADDIRNPFGLLLSADVSAKDDAGPIDLSAVEKS